MSAPVYVDDMYLHSLGQFGRMKMSHMISESTEALLAMATGIGVQTKWIQKRGTAHEHFDVSMGAREKAIARGAIAISMRQTSAMVGLRRLGLPFGDPATALERYTAAKEERRAAQLAKEAMTSHPTDP